MRALIFLLAGCAVAAPAIPATQPASAQALIGRLAGPPASLRIGVVTYDLPATRPEPPHHHHM